MIIYTIYNFKGSLFSIQTTWMLNYFKHLTHFCVLSVEVELLLAIHINSLLMVACTSSLLMVACIISLFMAARIRSLLIAIPRAWLLMVIRGSRFVYGNPQEQCYLWQFAGAELLMEIQMSKAGYGNKNPTFLKRLAIAWGAGRVFLESKLCLE